MPPTKLTTPQQQQHRTHWRHHAPTARRIFIMPDFKTGQIVQLNDGRKATVRFAGQTSFQVGEWIGVELEDKTGKNDGSVQGQRYFDCPMGYGMFVKPMMANIIAQPPAVAKSGVKKVARPNSFINPTASRASIGNDATLNRRKSLNAPSPSPVSRTTRPASIGRLPGSAVGTACIRGDTLADAFSVS